MRQKQVTKLKGQKNSLNKAKNKKYTKLYPNVNYQKRSKHTCTNIDDTIV